jgi:hypothetical protein
MDMMTRGDVSERDLTCMGRLVMYVEVACLAGKGAITEAHLYDIFQLEPQKTIVVPSNRANEKSTNAAAEGHYSCHLCRKWREPQCLN